MAGQGREGNELDYHAADTVEREEKADTLRVDAEATGEFEGEVDIAVLGAIWLAGVVHENWEELIEGYRVEGEEAVGEKINVGLAGKYLEWVVSYWDVVNTRDK